MNRFTGWIRSVDWRRAASELVLIIAGVSIALWADAWFAERLDRDRERARMTALHADVSSTLSALTAARQKTSQAAEALRRIVTLSPASTPDSQVILTLREGLLSGPTFYPEMSVYEDLKNSGELALLTNPALRQALSRMDARLEQLRVAQADLATVQTLNIDTYMVNNMDLRTFYGTMTGLQEERIELREDLDYLADRQFRNRVLLKLDVVTWLEKEFIEAEPRFLEVQRYLEKELKLK